MYVYHFDLFMQTRFKKKTNKKAFLTNTKKIKLN